MPPLQCCTTTRRRGIWWERSRVSPEIDLKNKILALVVLVAKSERDSLDSVIGIAKTSKHWIDHVIQKFGTSVFELYGYSRNTEKSAFSRIGVRRKREVLAENFQHFPDGRRIIPRQELFR